jgi:transposase
VGYIPSEQISTYRELVRLHTQSLMRKLLAIRTRSMPWWWCSFPSSLRCLLILAYPALWRCGNTYPHAQAVAKAGVEPVYQVLRGVPSAHFGRPTAKKLVLAAQASSSSSRVLSGRESLLCILCDQLEHTQAKRTAIGRAVGAVDQHRSANQGLAADTRTGAEVGGCPAC